MAHVPPLVAPDPPLPRAPTAPRERGHWAVAEQVSDGLRRHWGVHLQAVGVFGPLAHGDDSDASSVEILVVTKWSSGGPPPGSRRIDGAIVDMAVIGAEEYLRHARTLTTSWPLVADQYITTKPLHDPDDWLPRLRDAHLARLAQAQSHVFASLAREAWLRAFTAHARARRGAEVHDPDSAALLFEARLGVALVEGLLTRTYFRSSADAMRRAGVAGSHLGDLGRRLDSQADDLARRGRPVDGTVSDLLGR